MNIFAFEDQKEYNLGSTDKSQEIKAIFEKMQVYKQDKSNKEHQNRFISLMNIMKIQKILFLYIKGDIGKIEKKRNLKN